MQKMFVHVCVCGVCVCVLCLLCVCVCVCVLCVVYVCRGEARSFGNRMPVHFVGRDLAWCCIKYSPPAMFAL